MKVNYFISCLIFSVQFYIVLDFDFFFSINLHFLGNTALLKGYERFRLARAHCILSEYNM